MFTYLFEDVINVTTLFKANVFVQPTRFASTKRSVFGAKQSKLDAALKDEEGGVRGMLFSAL